jgi:hypothetical protein
MTKGTQSRDVLIQMAVARQIRSQRAAFKRALREGRLDPVSVFIDPPPPVQGARLAEVLKSIPGIGPQKCERDAPEPVWTIASSSSPTPPGNRSLIRSPP